MKIQPHSPHGALKNELERRRRTRRKNEESELLKEIGGRYDLKYATYADKQSSAAALGWTVGRVGSVIDRIVRGMK